MAHHQSAKKRIRQTAKRREYNRSYKAMLKKAIRAVEESTTFDTAMENFNKASSVLDRCAAKRIIHKNKAANKKAKLYKTVAGLK
jgi:small subunit ribosomal protein S20